MQSIIYIDLVLTQDKGRPFIHGWSFILSILFNVREVRYNGRSHRWTERFHRRYKLGGFTGGGEM